ncbi:MAG TPA: DUF2848 domain-containing protein [Bryobacteraceae bacterium]|nr:DUF2848 domain-containing protein [Bryobacteraceae bacterium]
MTTETNLPGCIHQVILAGWTGRDRAALEKHMAELELVGVRRPPTTPVYYRVSSSRVTTSDSIEVTGTDSSGEVEFIMLQTGGSLWIGVGSDHTDRKVETYNITVSKQMCDKPIASGVWLFDELSDHWDSLVLRSWAVNGGDRRLYQEGSVSSMLHPHDLMAGYVQDGNSLDEGTAMFSGTLPAIGGIQPADRFEFELEDPVRKRRLAHGYDIRRLPVAG